VNGSVGIAVGMATNIPPHNLGEVIDGIRLLIENPDVTLDELTECIKGPDFPTGGIIMGRAGIRAAYGTGRGKITLRANAVIEEIDGRNCIIVDEIPYQVNKARLIEAIAHYVKDKKLEGIHYIRDESDKGGMRIVIELKHNANPQLVLSNLYSHTQMQETVGVIMLALVNGEPKVLTLKQMLEEYHKFQVEVIINRTRFELGKLRDREEVLQGLAIAAENLDEVIKICRTSSGRQEIEDRLCERFFLSKIQAEAIARMQLYQLSNMERQKIVNELAEITVRIKELSELLASESKINAVIIDELTEIKRKFNDERRTRIENVSGEIDIEDLIPNDEHVITFTNIGYIKRLPVDTYKLQRRGGRGVSGIKRREEDFVSEMFTANAHDNILFITNKGLMFRLKCYEISEGSKNSRGVNVINMLRLDIDGGEKISAIINTTGFDEDKFLTMVTKNGIIKRTPLHLYKNRRVNGLAAITLGDGDEIAGVMLTDGNAELIAATQQGMVIRTPECNIRALSRTARGVKLMKLREGDRIASTAVVRENAELLFVTDKGYGKRCAAANFRLQNRGGLGIRGYKVSPEKGIICGVRIIDEGSDIILISTDGIVIRIRACDVSVLSRWATGVKLMRVSEGEKVATFTDTERDEEAEVETVEAPTEADLAEPAPEEIAAEEAAEKAAEAEAESQAAESADEE